MHDIAPPILSPDRFATVVPEPVTYAELIAQSEPKIDWLWQNYLARGDVILLTSQWKAGKTTLLSVLLARMRSGGVVAGLEVLPARAAVVSEEDPKHWRERGERLDFRPHVRFFPRPFASKPSPEQWLGLLDRIARMKTESALDLVVVDSLAQLIPHGAENNSDRMLEVLRPLERLTRLGVTVLLLHHPRKGALRPGQAARGSGALSAYVDVVVEMDLPGRPKPDDRRRRLCAWSRHNATPRELVIELTADGRDYVVSELTDEDLELGLSHVCELLDCAGQQMTRTAMLESWLAGDRPNAGTLWRWLDAGVKRKKLARYGTGRRADPFRYQLPGDELPWQQTMADIQEDLARFL